MDTRRSISGLLRRQVFERDRYTCQYCGSIDNLSIDHIWPQSKGGTDEISNLITSCEQCNESKRDKTLREWISGERKKQLTVFTSLQPEPTDEKVEFEVPVEKIGRFIDAVLSGKNNINHVTWVGCGKLFSRREYDLFVSQMVKVGAFRWKNPRSHNRGMVISTHGKRILQTMREEISKPTE